MYINISVLSDISVTFINKSKINTYRTVVFIIEVFVVSLPFEVLKLTFLYR